MTICLLSRGFQASSGSKGGLSQADGVINIPDVVRAVLQFNHSCA